MSKVNELIAELCPNGVEYKSLGDVGIFLRGSSFQKKNFVNEGTPCIHYGQVHTRFTIATDTVVSYLDESFAAKMKRAQPGDLIIATTSEDDDAVGKAVAWLGNSDVVVSNDAYIYRHSADPKYMAYVFASDLFQVPKRQYITGTKVRRLSDRNMAKIVIPVPPIEVQREVVHVLDEFTAAHDELIRQLENEMSLRIQQLSIARNQLVVPGNQEELKWATLGELGDFYGGLTGKSKKDFGDGMPFVTYMQVYANASMPFEGFERVIINDGERQNAIAVGDVLITISSENQEDAGMTCVVTHAPDEATYLNSFCTGWRPNDVTTYHPEYLKHLLRSDAVRAQIRRSANGVTRFNISKPKLAKTKLPIPPMEYQLEVAQKLDDLTHAVEQISAAIESETELLALCLAETRNKLVSFPEKAA